MVKKIWEETGLTEGMRHPATYLLEAADDITYICDDIEDGAKKGYINWRAEYADLKHKFSDKSDKYRKLFKIIDSKEPDSDMDESEKDAAYVRNFRNLMQVF